MRAWLDDSGIDYQIDAILVADGVVRIDAAGAGDPPSLLDLSERLNGVAAGLTPRLNWSKRETIEPGDEVATPLELVTESIRIEAEAWAAAREDPLWRGVLVSEDGRTAALVVERDNKQIGFIQLF